MARKVILDPSWRKLDELFSPEDLAALKAEFNVVWAQDASMPEAELVQELTDAFAYIAATPAVDADCLSTSPNLKAVIEVSGAFPDTIDYAACAQKDVEVLCCAPGFRHSVAEMGVAMALSGARGLVAEHELFRDGEEYWLDDRAGRDFSLYNATVGFVGYGQIAREIHRLLRPFQPQVVAYDPWLPDHVARDAGIRLDELKKTLGQSQVLFVTAVPTKENKGMIDAHALAALPDQALVILISRAHLVDFDALIAEVETGRLRAAIDVFPTEPFPQDHPARTLPGLILSPHRAAAVQGGRQLIGKLILQDLRDVAKGNAPSGLQRMNGLDIAQLAGTGNAREVADMAGQRG